MSLSTAYKCKEELIILTSILMQKSICVIISNGNILEDNRNEIWQYISMQRTNESVIIPPNSHQSNSYQCK